MNFKLFLKTPQYIFSYLKRKPISLAIAVSLLYALYLVFASRVDLSGDASGYENLGNLLYEGKWKEYFIDGPSREIVYPALVALGKVIEHSIGMDKYLVIKLMQVVTLLIVQFQMIWLLTYFKIHRFIIAGIIFYIGISPALVNSTLSLYSEIFTLPLVLNIFILTPAILSAIKNEKIFKTVGVSLLYVLNALVLVFSKALFLYVHIALAIIISGLIIFNNRREIVKKLFFITSFILIFSFIFCAGIHVYKSVNLYFNGNYVLTNRGPYIIYGNAVKRTVDLNKDALGAAIAFVPGKGVCEKIYFVEQCDQWSIARQDQIGMVKFNRLMEDARQPLKMRF